MQITIEVAEYLMSILFNLLKLRWIGRGGTPIPRDRFPTLEPLLIKNGRFTASGWRDDAENYLFLSRADADGFKKNIQQIHHSGLRAKIQILEITGEEVAHLDLDPVHRSKRHVTI
jgi:hypothetical protein